MEPHEPPATEPILPPLEPDDPMRHPAEVVAHARQRHGVAGALLAGAMVGLQQVLDPRKREEPAVVVEAAGEPDDIDRTGMTIASIDGVTVHAPPQQRETAGSVSDRPRSTRRRFLR